MARHASKWYAVATTIAREGVPARIVITKAPGGRIRGGRYAFGPYRTRREACEVGQYQSYGYLPRGCEKEERAARERKGR